jgi:hypothetical protein
MHSVSRNLALALAVTLVVALAGCGGDDKKTTSTATTPTVATAASTTPAGAASTALDAAQFSTLNKGAEQVVKDLTAIGKATTACGTAGGSSSDVGACVSKRLDKAVGELTDLAGSVQDVSATVTGTCQTDLRAFADDIKALGANFKKAAKSLLSGDGDAATTTLRALPLEDVQTTGTAAQQSCKPAAGR